MVHPSQSSLPPTPDIAPPPLRRSARISKAPDRYGYSPDIFHTHTSMVATLFSTTVLKSYLEAVKYDCWKQAIEKELDTLKVNHT